MNTIALLGGSKFIGPHLIKALSREGHKITIFNRNITCPPFSYPEGINIVEGDRNNSENLKYLFRTYFDVVFDLSGFTPDHIEPIILDCSQNIGHYIFCSTSSVYKTPPICPITEETPRLFDRQTYGGAKSIVENLLLEKHLKDGWPVTIFRPQAVFGPYDPWAIGIIYYRLINSLPIQLKINSKNRINPLYIHDLVNACITTINNKTSHGAVYGIAGDDTVTLNGLIKRCSENMMREPIINYVDTEGPANSIKNLSSYWLNHDQETDCNKIKKDLGIKFTPINDGIKETIRWIQNNNDYIEKYSVKKENYLLLNKPILMHIKSVFNFKDLLKVLYKTIINLKQLLNNYLD